MIRRALAKSPGARYPSAGDLGRAAEAAAAGVPVAEPERSVARGAAATAVMPTATLIQPSRRRPRRAALALAGAAVTAVAAAGVLIEARPDDPATPERRPAPSPPTPSPSAEAVKPRVAATVRWGSRPNSLAPTGNRIWVGAWRTGSVAAIDTGTNQLLRSLRPPVTGGTADMVATAEALWVATRAGELLRLHPRHGGRLADPVTLTMRPSAIAVRGDDIWIAQQVRRWTGWTDRPRRCLDRHHRSRGAGAARHPGNTVRPWTSLDGPRRPEPPDRAGPDHTAAGRCSPAPGVMGGRTRVRGGRDMDHGD